MATMKRAFMSHSWRDKSLARRIAYRLTHRGVPVWIDESEMQVGDHISDRLADEIRGSSHLLVLLSEPAVRSKWVAQEIAVARAATTPPVTVIPLLAEPGIASPVLDESLGLDLFDPLLFEQRMDTLASAILGSTTLEPRAPALLRRDLEVLGRQAPALKALIDQLLLTGQLTHGQLDAVTVRDEYRHEAETALIALHEQADGAARYVISLVAARLFRVHGIGFPVLARQQQLEPGGSDNLATMFSHIGATLSRPQDLDGAFRLFQLADPPQDLAFTSFVRENFDAFTPAQVADAVARVVTPDRGPARFAIDAAYALFARLPDNRSLAHLWFFWVKDYRFGGEDDAPGNARADLFYGFMNDAARGGLSQFDSVVENFRSAFRRLARKGTTAGMDAAVDLLLQAAHSRYVDRHALAKELLDALHSAEWDGPRRQQLAYQPLFDLAMAIGHDESYSAALRALTDWSPAGSTDVP